MLACVPEAIFTRLNPKTLRSEETQVVAKTKTTSKTKSKTKSPARASAKSASHKTKTSTAKVVTPKGRPVGEKTVTVDRRRGARRDEEQAAAPPKPVVAPAKLERRQKVNRRRQIDPTTCERDYTDNEVEFMNALDDYKRKNGRMFPTCSEVLEVVRSLGYVRLSPSELAAREPNPTPELALVTVAAEEDQDEEELGGDWR
jgi:hypothetical protein